MQAKKKKKNAEKEGTCCTYILLQNEVEPRDTSRASPRAGSGTGEKVVSILLRCHCGSRSWLAGHDSGVAFLVFSSVGIFGTQRKMFKNKIGDLFSEGTNPSNKGCMRC